MAVLTRKLDLSGTRPDEARAAIKQVLEEAPTSTMKVYASLAHKVWSLLVERRFDDEVRDWHGLLLGVKSKVRSKDAAAAERIAALVDLLRESISLAETSPAREVAKRPQARRILGLLDEQKKFVSRRVLMEKLALRSSYVSNVLTQLAAHDLIERREQGKEAEFRITRLGREMLGSAAADQPNLNDNWKDVFGQASTPQRTKAVYREVQIHAHSSNTYLPPTPLDRSEDLIAGLERMRSEYADIFWHHSGSIKRPAPRSRQLETTLGGPAR